MKYALQITRCTDPAMWYAGLIGNIVPFLGTWPEAYKSREPEGFINMVKFEDAKVIEVE